MKKKTDKLTEAQVDKTYEIVRGFNVVIDAEEKRFDPGKTKPAFVFEKDFEPSVWKDLVSMGAVRKFEDPTDLKPGEQIVAEEIEA